MRKVAELTISTKQLSSAVSIYSSIGGFKAAMIFYVLIAAFITRLLVGFDV